MSPYFEFFGQVLLLFPLQLFRIDKLLFCSLVLAFFVWYDGIFTLLFPWNDNLLVAFFCFSCKSAFSFNLRVQSLLFLDSSDFMASMLHHFFNILVFSCDFVAFLHLLHFFLLSFFKTGFSLGPFWEISAARFCDHPCWAISWVHKFLPEEARLGLPLPSHEEEGGQRGKEFCSFSPDEFPDWGTGRETEDYSLRWIHIDDLSSFDIIRVMSVRKLKTSSEPLAEANLISRTLFPVGLAPNLGWDHYGTPTHSSFADIPCVEVSLPMTWTSSSC